MPLDPEVKAMLEQMQGMPPMHTLPVDVVRAGTLQMAEAMKALPKPAIKGSVDRTIPGPAGDLPVRVYTPEGTGPFPLVMFFHGGGFVICNLDTHDGMCRHLCAGGGAVVVSVDYRLAPEHKFPAAPDDCVAATRWAAAHAAELGADPSRIVVAGDSAGGNLAAVVALRLRDEGGPALCGQLLFYPVTDHYQADTASYRENAEGYGLTRDAMIWFWDHYLNGPDDIDHPYASPLRAPSLAGLPPALVISAEYDVLRDEAELYAGRLQDAGVPVQLTRYDGVHHGFASSAGALAKADRAMEEASAWLRERFGA